MHGLKLLTLSQWAYKLDFFQFQALFHPVVTRSEQQYVENYSSVQTQNIHNRSFQACAE